MNYFDVNYIERVLLPRYVVTYQLKHSAMIIIFRSCESVFRKYMYIFLARDRLNNDHSFGVNIELCTDASEVLFLSECWNIMYNIISDILLT